MATSPSSMTTWSTPIWRSRSALPGARVVEITLSPRRLARMAAAMPTDDVPPRTSRLCPGCASRPTVRLPCAVWSISGTAPSSSTGMVAPERDHLTRRNTGELGVPAVEGRTTTRLAGPSRPPQGSRGLPRRGGPRKAGSRRKDLGPYCDEVRERTLHGVGVIRSLAMSQTTKDGTDHRDDLPGWRGNVSGPRHDTAISRGRAAGVRTNESPRSRWPGALREAGGARHTQTFAPASPTRSRNRSTGG